MAAGESLAAQRSGNGGKSDRTNKNQTRQAAEIRTKDMCCCEVRSIKESLHMLAAQRQRRKEYEARGGLLPVRF
ncbi:MAG: hypothetical protein FWD58_02095 [Firmicutes bacterium]|nr:hypothetical protein [Bacillota bacterium]